MRISDWSSDVCSSDLFRGARVVVALGAEAFGQAAEHRDTPGARCGQPFVDGRRAPEGARRAGTSCRNAAAGATTPCWFRGCTRPTPRSEEHTSELQSLMRHSYAVFCLKKLNNNKHIKTHK